MLAWKPIASNGINIFRAHQKVIEEAPALGMDAATREFVCATAVAAARALAAACAAVEVWPVRTNAAFLARLAADAAFTAADIDKGFIERHAEALIPAAQPSDEVVRAAAGALLPRSGVRPPCAGALPPPTSGRSVADPWLSLIGFQPNASPCGAAPETRVRHRH